MALFVHIILTKCEKLPHVFELCFEKWFLNQKKVVRKEQLSPQHASFSKDLIFITYYIQTNKWSDMI